MMIPIVTDKVSTAAFYSPAMDLGNGTILFSGQVALTADNGFINDSFEAETDQVFKNIDALLGASNCSKTNIAKVTVYLADINDYSKMNAKYTEYMGDHAPARTCIQVGALPLGAQIEIEVTAVKN